MSMPAIRVLIADDHPLFRKGLRALLTTRVLAYLQTPRPPAQLQALPSLTARAREVRVLIAQGHSTPAIAERLVLSPKTVRNYVSEIFGTIQVADRTQAAVRARDAGL